MTKEEANIFFNNPNDKFNVDLNAIRFIVKDLAFRLDKLEATAQKPEVSNSYSKEWKGKKK